MRYIRPEPEPDKKWGTWTRAPRNGHEWKMLHSGKAQPKEKTWRTMYKCRVHGAVTYKVVCNGDAMARRCLICDAARRKRYDKKWWKKNKDHRNAIKRALRSKVPEFEDGVTCVSATWLRFNVGHVPEYLVKGNMIVETFGEAAYVIMPLEALR